MSEPAKRLFTLWDTRGAYIVHHWRTTETDARRYAERYAYAGTILTGPRGETLARY